LLARVPLIVEPGRRGRSLGALGVPQQREAIQFLAPFVGLLVRRANARNPASKASPNGSVAVGSGTGIESDSRTLSKFPWKLAESRKIVIGIPTSAAKPTYVVEYVAQPPGTGVPTPS